MASNKLTDVQKDLLEDVYLAGADKKFVTIDSKGKVFMNKLGNLVQKGYMEANTDNPSNITYKLTEMGVSEAHKAFNQSRS